MTSGVIKQVAPRAGVEGGEAILSCEGYDTSGYQACGVFFDAYRGRLVSASRNRVIVAVPELPQGISTTELRLESATGSDTIPFTTGTLIADDLHPVANPAIDHESGAIYVTRSGARGQQVPVSIYRITSDGAISPFSSDIMNPTGLAFDREGALYVTNRHDGTLYRFTPFGDAKEITSDLGIATGIAIDRRGDIYVGDRSGTIYRVNELGETRPFASLEPSVSAYHLAFGPDGALYVAGPTVSSFDAILRVDAMGNVMKFYSGLGRPQGLAFDIEGNLYVAASLAGQRGVVRITPDGVRAEIVLAGASLVGLAFDEQGNMIVVSTQRVYRVPMAVRGYSVFGS